MTSPAPVFLAFCAVINVINAVFLIRPFLNGRLPTTFGVPRHNFWPYIPIIPPVKDNKTYYGLPKHNFWPWIPVVPPDGDGLPVTPPGPTPPWPRSDGGHDYGEALYKSILFYEAQRSGYLPANNRITWRGNSALNDKGMFGEDLTGGWYDAGDYVKFGFPMAGSTTMLIWGLVEFKEAYTSSGLLEDMYDCIRWPLDYFQKAHPTKYEFYAQVGDPYVDHSYWGRPEDMDMYRPAYRLTPERPGSDVIAETAAALAAGFVAFKSRGRIQVAIVERNDIGHSNQPYAERLLRHAVELFDFADRYRGKYSDSIPIVEEFYRSSGYRDELTWAAAWLYRATGLRKYLIAAERNYDRGSWAQSWDEKTAGATVLLYRLTKQSRYRREIEELMRNWMPGGSVDYTPKGLAFRQRWGSLRYSANMAMVALAAANLGINPERYRRWSKEQIHYMLGDSGRSYVIGYGFNPPTRPHHASSSCDPNPWPCNWSDFEKSEPNTHILYGALVGGPDIYDNFVDDRADYIHNEVTTDYNAGFQSSLAGLKAWEIEKMKAEGKQPTPFSSLPTLSEIRSRNKDHKTFVRFFRSVT